MHYIGIEFRSHHDTTEEMPFYGFIVHITTIYNINPLLFVNGIVSAEALQVLFYDFTTDVIEQKSVSIKKLLPYFFFSYASSLSCSYCSIQFC